MIEINMKIEIYESRTPSLGTYIEVDFVNIYYNVPVSTGILPHSFPNGRLGQDLGFGGIAFALKLPELLNTNLAAVRAKLGQTSCFPNGRACFKKKSSLHIWPQQFLDDLF